jgi:hypothetical protein
MSRAVLIPPKTSRGLIKTTPFIDQTTLGNSGGKSGVVMFLLTKQHWKIV